MPLTVGESRDVVASRALAAFLRLLSSRPGAQVLELGPAIGSNIAFLGEQFGCKIHIKDLYADLDRHANEAALDRLPEFLHGRFAEFDENIDGVLCWDLFDYLSQAAASVLAVALIQALRPGGALLAFFGAGTPGEASYTRYLIEQGTHVRFRVSPAACGRQRVLQNRDILRLFTGLDLFDSVLMRSGVREVLFRKPGAT
jgi:protein-L-isoaspartate O-methyltransferase